MRVSKHGCDVLDSHVFWRILFIKAIEHFFHVYIASSKYSEGWENSQKLLHNCLKFSQPSLYLDEAM